MKDENETNAPVADAAPAAPKPAPKPASKPRDPYIRAENEDDDGYDPYSDRRPERDPELVREPYQLATERIEGFCPKAAEVLEEAEAGAPAYLDFPYGHRVRLRADNVQGRTDRELRRRGRVVQVFPSRKSPIRMMGAVFAEMDEDWAGRRRLDDDSIGRAVEGAEVNAPAPAYGGHRRGARCRDHRARRGRQPRSRREGGLT